MERRVPSATTTHSYGGGFGYLRRLSGCDSTMIGVRRRRESSVYEVLAPRPLRTVTNAVRAHRDRVSWPKFEVNVAAERHGKASRQKTWSEITGCVKFGHRHQSSQQFVNE